MPRRPSRPGASASLARPSGPEAHSPRLVIGRGKIRILETSLRPGLSTGLQIQGQLRTQS